MLLSDLLKSDLLSKIFPTQHACLKHELEHSQSILDLGCGPDSPISNYKNKYTVGVEYFTKYYQRAARNKTHSKLIHSNISSLNFPTNSFDTVVLTEVIEHMTKKEALSTLQKAKRWAKKNVVVTTPNGFLPQQVIDGNSKQQHLSGWTTIDLQKLGFQKIQGLAGLKSLRQPVEHNVYTGDILTTIKFKPKMFWFIISALSQMITYYLPEKSFELFAVYYK